MHQLDPPLSTPARRRDFERLASRRWDLLVVGGGISGTAVARDAALRGLRVALVEQADFAFGTSSRSSRLVHGGLRYLAHLDFALVREGLVERRRLLDSAPGLVREVEFLYPVYRGDPDPVWKVNLGVSLYELLAFGYGLGGKRRLDAGGVRATVPQLRSEGLRGGVLYRDAATHDTRLTLAVGLAARREGALLVSRCRAAELIRDGERVIGAEIEDRIDGDRIRVEADAVVLCCGPWQNLYGRNPVKLFTARGTHLSLSRRRLPLASFIALRSPDDGRLAFAMPLGEHTVIGTTDQHDASAPGWVRPTREDTEYLLRLANHSFPGADLETADVTGAWAGLRPLVSSEPGAAADEISREHQIIPGPPGLWILAGGKLTTHRAMAEDILDRVVPTLSLGGREARRCRTHRLPLLTGSLDEGIAELGAAGVPEAKVRSLAAVYGSRLEALARRLEQHPCTPESLFDAQVDLAVDEEWALSLDDLLLRRIGAGALDLRLCWRAAPRAAVRMAEHLGWSRHQTTSQVDDFRAGVVTELAAAGIELDPAEELIEAQ